MGLERPLRASPHGTAGRHLHGRGRWAERPRLGLPSGRELPAVGRARRPVLPPRGLPGGRPTRHVPRHGARAVGQEARMHREQRLVEHPQDVLHLVRPARGHAARAAPRRSRSPDRGAPRAHLPHAAQRRLRRGGRPPQAEPGEPRRSRGQHRGDARRARGLAPGAALPHGCRAHRRRPAPLYDTATLRLLLPQGLRHPHRQTRRRALRCHRLRRALRLPEPRRLRARDLRAHRAGGRLGRLPPILSVGAGRRA
mmetsp:Transcript_30582/g.77983  ORF Transcript_30582/g.77983 Transcript_30582/m.77983 type:complete len:254 (-) Transcript_30582:209-970(-)